MKNSLVFAFFFSIWLSVVLRTHFFKIKWITGKQHWFLFLFFDFEDVGYIWNARVHSRKIDSDTLSIFKFGRQCHLTSCSRQSVFSLFINQSFKSSFLNEFTHSVILLAAAFLELRWPGPTSESGSDQQTGIPVPVPSHNP